MNIRYMRISLAAVRSHLVSLVRSPKIDAYGHDADDSGTDFPME